MTLPGVLDDIENQKAFRLARQVDPSGHRTIGMYSALSPVLHCSA